MTKEIDEELYSRQLYVLGIEAMKRMAGASVLISGMGGLGVEIAKNIILAGINKVTIHDTKDAEMLDLGSQFYLTESDLGKNRALSSLAKLTELNHYVTVDASTEPVTTEFLAKYNTVVFTEPLCEAKLLEYSDFCHSKGICFIACETSGVFGTVFDDFGPEFVVVDPRGEQPSRFLIEHISNDEKGIVQCAAKHNLTDGDYVRFEEVCGMTEVNDMQFEAKVINAFKFSIGDTSKFHPYEAIGSGGYGNQIIAPVKLSFDSLRNQLACPTIIEVDMCQWGRDQQNVLAFMTMHKILDDHNKVTDVAFEEVKKIAETINAGNKLVDEIDEKVLKALYSQYGYVISPMAGVIGGIVGQEVLKSVSGKFTPIKQFMPLSYLEALPETVVYEPAGDRYDAYRAVFGNAQQDVMQKLKYFMIGAGAIGCEVLKNWAMMGVSTGENGKITVTDMDRIEKSNLSRQFLFRDHNIGQMKSESACEAVRHMNKDLKTEAMTNKLDESTRDIYNDDFYTNLDGVCNALDNVEARVFSDSMCVYYRKPLLESGTLGPKANYQVVVPGITESYASSADPPEDNIPACTLHNFPSIMDHCCLWGRDIFSGMFEQQPDLVNKFIDDPNFVDNGVSLGMALLRDNLTSIYNEVAEKPASFDDCAKWGRLKFEELFNFKIRDLLHVYPVDYVTSSGGLFWSGSKRPPTPLTFDASNEYHAEFVVASATLHARIHGIEVGTREHILAVAAATEVPEWTPSETKVDTGDDDSKDDGAPAESMKDILELVEKIRSMGSALTKLHPEKFEKDDNTNSHMDFIAAAANLRALNYKISTASKLEIKRIAGKIIPAIATTTAMICGFVCLEMYKIHCITPKKLDDFRSGFVNLALSMFSLTEPIGCAQSKYPNSEETFSALWDWVDIDNGLTVKDLIQMFKTKYGLTLSMLSYGKLLLYGTFLGGAKKKQRMPMKIIDVLKEVLKGDIPPHLKFVRLTVMFLDSNYDEVPMPDLRMMIPK